jgi:hypothetical protein
MAFQDNNSSAPKKNALLSDRIYCICYVYSKHIPCKGPLLASLVPHPRLKASDRDIRRIFSVLATERQPTRGWGRPKFHNQVLISQTWLPLDKVGLARGGPKPFLCKEWEQGMVHKPSEFLSNPQFQLYSSEVSHRTWKSINFIKAFGGNVCAILWHKPCTTSLTCMQDFHF